MTARNRRQVSLQQAASADPAGGGSARVGASALDHPLADEVERVLALIRPAVQADGGDIELVDITPECVVQVRFHGACVGCPSSSITLQTGIERNLRSQIPSITGVVAVS
ncbi:MAG: NifU family protein [Phycisphaerales bacterium]